MSTNVLCSPLPPVEVENVAVHTYIQRSLHRYNHRLALQDTGTGRKYRYRDVDTLSARLAAGLQRCDLQRGDLVTLASPNCSEYVIALQALWRCGAVPVLVNPAQTPDEFQRAPTLAETRFLLVHESVLAHVTHAMGDAINKVKVIVIGSSSTHVTVEQLWSDLQAVPARCDVTQEDLAAILFSSGTTGLPKAVEITHRNLSFVSQVMTKTWSIQGHLKEGYYLVPQPMYHIFGLIYCVNGLVTGCTLVPMPKFVLEDYARLILLYKVTDIAVPPPVLMMLTQTSILRNKDLSFIDNVVSGAAPCSQALEDRVRQTLGAQIKIGQGYGMTENAGLTHFAPYGRERTGSVGVLIPGVEAKVVGDDVTSPLGPHQRGELWVRTPGRCRGYRGNPRATMATMDGEWLKTGDVVYYDEDGYFFIVDRLKELIKYKGFQVAPAELEALLLSHPGVADAAVVGLRDVTAGELPTAFVVRRAGSDVTEAQIHIYVNDRVSHYKRLRGGIRFVESVPKSPSGKILRRPLRAKLNTQAKL